MLCAGFESDESCDDACPMLDYRRYEPVDTRATGFGGYGTVYKYRQRATGEVVAVKLVKPPRARGEDPLPLLRRSVAGMKSCDTHRHDLAIPAQP
jgi:serine/threonine protein kinase